MALSFAGEDYIAILISTVTKFTK